MTKLAIAAVGAALGVLAGMWLAWPWPTSSGGYPTMTRVETLPRCLSEWRQIRPDLPGSFVMVATWHVQKGELRIETADGKLLGVIRAGQVRSWTCDWPATMPLPAFAKPAWTWRDA